MKSTAIRAAAVAAILSCLLVLCAQGQPAERSNSCQCSGDYFKLNKRFLVKNKPKFNVHYPTNFCPRMEIILIMADGKKKCVNPESPVAMLFLKQDRPTTTAATSSTVASGQTQTQSPATVQTTSNL
ncbi:unnamed protein product [Ophioblennius macclurei]